MKFQDNVTLAICATAVVLFTFIVALFVHMDGQTKAKVNTACVQAGGIPGSVDIAGDGKSAQRGCIFN